MSFEHVGDIEQVLRSDSVSVRDLHAMWGQRQPVPERDPRKPAGATPGRQIDWLQQDVALARLFTRHALEKEEFLLVLDAAREILRLVPTNPGDHTELLRVRMDYAAALTRLALTRDARRVLEPCLAPTFRPVLGRRLQYEVLLQVGNILREESHHAAAKAAQLQTAGEALEFYKRALALEPERLDALILTAAAAFVLGEEGSTLRDEARAKARDALALVKAVEDDQGESLETTWVRGTALTVLGDVDAAARAYGRLQSFEGVTTARLADCRYWTEFLAEALDEPRDFFKPAFPPLQLIVFAGHLPDRQERSPRFPAESVPAVRETLRKQLEAVHARVGLVSASAGADLLFIEALRARQGTVHLVLPWSQDEFRRTSILPYEPAGAPPFWTPLFDKAIDEAATIREIGQVYEPSGDVGWEYMTEVTAGIALNTARASRLDVQPMALWDGLPGRGAGGTDSFVGFWQVQLQQKPIVIRPPVPAAPGGEDVHHVRSARCERPGMRQEVKSMLFADIVGYSKLTEKVIPEFVGSFLERVSQLAATSKHAPCSVNTWGDAVYAVFDFARDAGLFALEITQMVQEGRAEWLQKGLYWEDHGEKRPLNIRIGLHAGPVVMHYDPVVRRLGFTGSHVNRAARIEPVARPGEVFASEEFAALAELAGEIERRSRDAREPTSDEGFVCEYAGTMQLAKGYPGRYRIYRVAPKRVLALEDLARAAHDAYCAESRARGDTPSTNPSLRPWEELTEDLRQANRAVVGDIPNKLRHLGWELAPSYGQRPSEIAISDADIEQLAIREHDRWMAERRRSGWTYAPTRDNARKHHPLLVPWEDLSHEEKEKDRDTIRNLPKLVERAGFRVRKLG